MEEYYYKLFDASETDQVKTTLYFLDTFSLIFTLIWFTHVKNRNKNKLEYRFFLLKLTYEEWLIKMTIWRTK